MNATKPIEPKTNPPMRFAPLKTGMPVFELIPRQKTWGLTLVTPRCHDSSQMASQLFRTKSPDHLMREAAAPERQMKRTLGAFDLTCIGIGAIIGSGIFAMTGTAAAGQSFSSRLETPVLNFIQAWFSGGEVLLGRAGAGPAIAVSFVIAAVACGFAALCYAELASMIPVSGSAYTYSYATLGEIIAWIIG